VFLKLAAEPCEEHRFRNMKFTMNDELGMKKYDEQPALSEARAEGMNDER